MSFPSASSNGIAAILALLFVCSRPPSLAEAQRCTPGVAARWESYRTLHHPQPISPTENGSHAWEPLFRETTRRVRTMISRFRPNAWGLGQIGLTVDPASAEERPRVQVDVRLRLGPVAIEESVRAEASHCPIVCRTHGPEVIGERIILDLRRAHGDLEGLVSGLGLDLCPVPAARPGWATVHSALLIGRAPGYDRQDAGARGRHTTDLLRHQIFRFMDAFRETYRLVKSELAR